MRSKILRFVLPIFVISLAFVIASYLKWTKPSVEPKPLTERAWTVSVTSRLLVMACFLNFRFLDVFGLVG